MPQVPYEQISRDILDALSKATAEQPLNDIELKDPSPGAAFPKARPEHTGIMYCHHVTFTGLVTLSVNAPMATKPLHFATFIIALAKAIEHALGPDPKPDRQANLEFSAVVNVPNSGRRTVTTGYVIVRGTLEISTAQ